MIKDIFKKDINRSIETVIKADDKNNISTEISEYVITDEISKKIKDLFYYYNNYEGANGVWISGFFGSGKSHLLKILSYVFENKEYGGYPSGELYAEKVEDDELLKADIQKASRIPCESILFNIDQQSQITSKADENAILSVFYKVFYDHLGYYGFQPHVAEFEMWLDKNNIYEKFKTAFGQIHPISWKNARTDYFDPIVTENIAKVLGDLNKQKASKYENILDDIEDRHKQSIEDFSKRVEEYINTKTSGFRLNFFVDEVGQYISDNRKLMLNLQTIAESLATKSKGKAWIFVTSQEDMESVIGNLDKDQEQDFSRIQARFKIKIPLTSANVDEVIEKRLLDKKSDAHKDLEKVFKVNEAHLKSLLSFSEAGVQFRGYENPKKFADKYPFVPYQFDLFQQCRIALSRHNAFQGRHASVGERSMLGVFQQVIQTIENREINTLASFDLMFEGIKNELKGEIQQSLILASRNLHNPFDIKVLKTLFLVKYFNNFKTTKRNISVLLIDDINIDLKEHEEKLDQALTVLENQSYIQRNGELYEFLTDDEKDVEEEIKNTEIDEQSVNKFLKEILFDEIIRDNRISYTANRQSYDFTNKVNGVTYGREKELEIEMITDDYESDENVLQSHTMGTTSMKMLLIPKSTFMRDVRMYLKTGKYARQNRGEGTNPQINRILQDKLMQNVTRKNNIIALAKQALATSRIFVNGSKLELSSSTDPVTHVHKGFQQLVATVYPNLRMINGKTFSENTIQEILHSPQEDLFAADNSTMSESENEVLNLVNRRKKQNDRTSLLDVKNEFIKKPYGWYPNAVWSIIAKLYKRGKIELVKNANVLEGEKVLEALRNSSNHQLTLLEPQAKFENADVNRLKTIYMDAFDESCSYREAKDIAVAFKDKLQQMSIEVNQLLVERNQYPFLESLQPLADDLNQWAEKEYAFFLLEQSSFEDKLLDAKEDYLDPIKRFLRGEQRKIFDEVKSLLNGNTANFSYIQGDELDTLKTLVNSNTPYKGNAIQLAKAAKDELKNKVLHMIEVEQNIAIDEIEKKINDIQSREDFSALEQLQQQQVISGLKELKKNVNQEKFISNIREAVRHLGEKHTQVLNAIQGFTKQAGRVDEKNFKYQRKNSIPINFDKSELQTEEDVLAYVEAIKTAYLDRIEKKIRITL